MIKKLTQLRFVLCIILVIEFLLALLLAVTINTKSLYILSTYLLFKNGLCLGVILYVSNVIKDTNYSVDEALDQDSKNALVFGGVGLIKYDENRNVIWISDLLRELKVNIVGEKLLEWQPLLAPLFEEEDVRTIDINSRKYEAYNSPQTRLIFLKDVTDYYQVNKEFSDQQLCVAYISVDNYEDSIEYANEQKAAEIQSITRQTILDWAQNNGIILKRYKSDAYIAIFNERVYHKFIDEKFLILDIFKNNIEPTGAVMGLSIGIGRGSHILRECEELAFSALSLAYSRGGDQVAIKSNEEDTRFYGGNSEGSEKNNRIRARVISQSLASLIKESDNIIIMGHKQSDFDSFGASIAMLALCRAHQKQAYIVLDFDSLEEKTGLVADDIRNDERYRGVFISPMLVSEIKTNNSLLVSVDNHKPSLAISDKVIDMIDRRIVIDHHRRAEEFIELPVLTYLEPAASSTVELLVELFEYQKVDISVTEREATIMYAGLLIDTNYLKTRVGARTLLVAAKLKEMQANVSRAYEFLKDDYSTSLSKLSITKNAYQFGNDILIAYGNDNEVYSRALLAKAGNELMNISGIKAAFVIGNVSKEEVAISARSSQDINVQLIMEKLGGGGHFSMAACQIKDSTIVDVTNQLETAINEYLDERKSD